MILRRRRPRPFPLQLAAIVVSLVATGALIRAVDDACTGTASRPHARARCRLRALRRPHPHGPARSRRSPSRRVFSWPFLAIYWLFKRDATIDGRRDWWLVLVPVRAHALPRRPLAIRRPGRHARGPPQLGCPRPQRLRRAHHVVARARHPHRRSDSSNSAPSLWRAPPNCCHRSPPPPSRALCFALVLPFAVTAQTLLYYDLIARKQTHDDDAHRLAVAQSDVPREGP